MADIQDEPTYIISSVRLPAELHARFDAVCDATYRSKSSTLVMLIEKYCAEVEANLTQGG